MWTKCVLVCVIFICFIDSFCEAYCRTPRIKNANVRVRYGRAGRRKTIRVYCNTGYELQGERLLTCIGRRWDDELPSCMKNGCTALSAPANGKVWVSNEGATTDFFCDPGYERVGPGIVYCNGSQWNDTTITTCVSTKTPPALSCDFEAENLCGWQHDISHDIDWQRFNKHTPSYFLRTGPDYDHTFGQGKYGYFMYLESTGILENYTARLISPIYDGKMTKDGCFSIFYNMYGRSMGGLRVYQKPVDIPMWNLTKMNDEQLKAAKYLLFEKWGDQGRLWRQNVTPLNNFTGEYQIVIEGIRGTGYTSDVAFDDVAIMQGENCTIGYSNTTISSHISTQSCIDRCVAEGQNETLQPNMCSCSTSCFDEMDCCYDYLTLCMGALTFTSDEDLDTDEDLGTTEKVATTSEPIKTFNVSRTTTPAVVTAKTTVLTTKANKTVQTSPVPRTTSQKPQQTTTQKPSTKKLLTKMPIRTSTESVVTKKYTKKDLSKKDNKIEGNGMHGKASPKSSHGVAITISVVILSCCIAAFVYWMRTARGRLVMSTHRGRFGNNQEVQYLTGNSDS